MSDPRFLGIIPIRGTDPEFADGPEVKLGDRPIIAYTIEAARSSRRLDRVVVSTDNPGIAALAQKLGAEASSLRPATMRGLGVSITRVLQHVVAELAEQGYVPDWVVKLEITHPFRPAGIIDRVIELALAQEVDSAFLAYPEPHSYWLLGEDGRPQQVGDDMDVPREIRRPIYRDVGGVVSLTRVENLRMGKMYGERVGLVPVDDVFVTVDLHEGHAAHYRDRVGFQLAESLVEVYRRAIEGSTSRR